MTCVFTHIFFGGLLFVMGIVDLLFSYDYGDFWTGLRFFVIFCGVWVGKLSFFPSAVNGSEIRLQLASPKKRKKYVQNVICAPVLTEGTRFWPFAPMCAPDMAW